MIISKTPVRISLFGGGTDFPEYFKSKPATIIGGSIDKFIYISIIKQNSKITKKKIKLFYRLKEEVKKISDIKHNVIKKALELYDLKDNVEIHISSDLPSYSGLGSSSAFSVGLLNLLDHNNQKKKTNYNLAKNTINFERKILKETVGWQDQIHATYGGFNKIIIYKNKFKVKKIINDKKLKKLEKNLYLVFTGITRKAQTIEKKKIKNIKKNKIYLDQINQITKKASKALKEKKIDLKKVGNLLDEMWNLKKKLSNKITNKKIDYIYNIAKKNGAIGGKLLGAGSGGFILFVVSSNKKNFFLKSMKNYDVVNFKFSSFGSQIFKL